MISYEQRRPALFEGIAITLIEAAHAGRPFIAEASGGCADAAVHGDTGLLVDPDKVDDVVQAIRRLLDDHQYADRLGARARQRALTDFTWEKAVTCMNIEMKNGAVMSCGKDGTHRPR